MSAGGEPGKEDSRRCEVEAAGRVAAALQHEFRNVLNPIVSAAWLLEANANDPRKVIELARRIGAFAQVDGRIAAKIRELIDREAAGRPATPPLQGNVREVTSSDEA